jgi:hypothetical protein
MEEGSVFGVRRSAIGDWRLAIGDWRLAFSVRGPACL